MTRTIACWVFYYESNFRKLEMTKCFSCLSRNSIEKILLSKFCKIIHFLMINIGHIHWSVKKLQFVNLMTLILFFKYSFATPITLVYFSQAISHVHAWFFKHDSSLRNFSLFWMIFYALELFRRKFKIYTGCWDFFW